MKPERDERDTELWLEQHTRGPRAVTYLLLVVFPLAGLTGLLTGSAWAGLLAAVSLMLVLRPWLFPCDEPARVPRQSSRK